MADDTTNDLVSDYPSWQAAAMGGNLLSYAWQHRPGLADIVPDAKPDDPWYQKALDVGSIPARLAVEQVVNPLVQGAGAMSRMLDEGYSPAANKDLTASLLGLTMQGLASPKPPGVLGTFGGSSAIGADLNALTTAKKMTESDPTLITPSAEGRIGNSIPVSSSRNDIWHSTGWFHDVDGEWKFEIPDTDAKWKDNVPLNKFSPPDKPLLALQAGKTVGDVFEHPELFRNYPELAETPVRGLPIGSIFGGTKGAVYVDGGIGIGAASPAEGRSIMLHELQHKIQEKENFARGGSLDNFLPDDFNQHYAAVEKAITPIETNLRANGVNIYAMNEALAGKRGYISATGPSAGVSYYDEHLAKARSMLSEDDLNNYKSLRNQMEQLDQTRKTAFAKYQNLAGEVEARNVQERDAQGDNLSPPWLTTGYPTENQIVRKFVKNPVGALNIIEQIDHNPFIPGASQ